MVKCSLNLKQNYSFGNDFPTPLFSACYKSSVLKEGDFLKWSCLVNMSCFQMCQSYLILSLIFKLSVSPAPASKNLSKICQIHNINPRPSYWMNSVSVAFWYSNWGEGHIYSKTYLPKESKGIFYSLWKLEDEVFETNVWNKCGHFLGGQEGWVSS